MAEDVQLNLEKFGSIGGDYFEHLIAVALDELGYVEDETYLASWANKCVPGTWIEADFIISRKNDKSGDPLNNGRVILAIGHATSENSAGMKFHRDVEQLLEVKALPNGEEYRVIDILFCCPRETMGGWSKELVAINEAIFDHSLTVWKHDWGRRLLQQIQLHGEKLTQGDNTAKKKKLKELLSKHPAFRKQFEALRDHLATMLAEKKSHSKIGDIFDEERKQLPIRLAMPLLITEPEKTDFKRGLLQVLALNPWEVELLHANHEKNRNGKVVPLEKLALDSGMSQKNFDQWWGRLQLLSAKLGTCSADFLGDEMLDPDAKEWRMFKAGSELSFILSHFPGDALVEVVNNIDTTSENLAAYVPEMRQLDRVYAILDFLNEVLSRNQYKKMYEGLCEHFEKGTFLDLPRKRLVLLEAAMATICADSKDFSYDKLAKASGDPDLVSNSNQFRRYPKLQGNPRQGKFQAATLALWARLKQLPNDWLTTERDQIVEKFLSRSLDGMVKQPRAGEGALDVLLKETISSFAKRTKASVKIAQDYQGEISAFSSFVGSAAAGVNVEVPYVLSLKDSRCILIHRVNANDGHAADKRKEFSSKIRSVRYQASKGRFVLRTDLAATVLVIDGKWIPESNEDPLSHIRMLTVAGWDYVVYPDQLSAAFAQIESKLGGLPMAAETATPARKKIALGSIKDLPMAAEVSKTPKLKRKVGHG
jgi:hypothetical protein